VVNLARFALWPLQTLHSWRGRYGEAFTVRLTGFGTGVYLTDPVAIRELFTGDQSDLHAGEANSFMEPVLGPHSVLVLDGEEHLRER
jgi:cytochrome P450 family 135